MPQICQFYGEHDTLSVLLTRPHEEDLRLRKCQRFVCFTMSVCHVAAYIVQFFSIYADDVIWGICYSLHREEITCASSHGYNHQECSVEKACSVDLLQEEALAFWIWRRHSVFANELVCELLSELEIAWLPS